MKKFLQLFVLAMLVGATLGSSLTATGLKLSPQQAHAQSGPVIHVNVNPFPLGWGDLAGVQIVVLDRSGQPAKRKTVRLWLSGRRRRTPSWYIRTDDSGRAFTSLQMPSGRYSKAYDYVLLNIVCSSVGAVRTIELKK